MAASTSSGGFLKKLRNKISKKKSYDIETPCVAGHGTILLRRYDRVPSTYGDGVNDRQNILRDFVPPVQKQQQSPSRFRGEVTLPRHFRVKSGHHRTQSNVTVVDHDDIDLYNAIGDHRRSSCSCACSTTSRNSVISPVTPTANNAFHLTQQNVHSVQSSPSSTSSPPSGTLQGRGRNAAKDPLPPIVRDTKKEQLDKEEERLKQAAAFEEAPRYTGIDDYSNVDFDPNAVTIPPNATLRPRAHQQTDQQREALRACMTLPPSSNRKPPPQVQPSSNSSSSSRGDPVQNKEPEDEVDGGWPSPPPPLRTAVSKPAQPPILQAQRHQRTENGIVDVVDCYQQEDMKISVNSRDLPIPHESCLNKERKPTQPVQCEQMERQRSLSPTDDLPPPPLSCSAPVRTFTQPQKSTEEDVRLSRHNYPHNTSHHEYKEAHQVLRATSMGRIDNLDLEVSSSVEDLYAHVPKGTKTPDIDDMEAELSDQNTDNEDSLPPPPIPSRNYRNTDNCCPTAAQLGGGTCTCSHLKDMETGEDLQEDGPQSVIHQQPKSNRGAADDIPQVVEPIHMTLEEVWQDACARGIPMEKPSTMTLHRRHKSMAPTPSTSSVADQVESGQEDEILDDSTEDCSTAGGSTTATNKKKEKFKLKNIFKKTDHNSPLKSPQPGHRRTLSMPAEATMSTVEDTQNCSDSLNTSGEMSSSELSESTGNASNCSSADSGVDDVTAAASQPEPARTINADFIESLRKLKDCGWYWGPLSWDGAESRLANKPDGSFLVRDSSDDRYILSISFRSQGTTHHTRIEHYKGTFSFFSQPKSHGAGTIIEFIEKAMEHSRSGKFLYFLRPRAPGFPPAPVQLLYPVSRFRVMQSLQHMCRFEILRATRYDHIDELPLPQKVKSYLRESQYYTEYILEYEGGDFMQL